MESHSNIIKRSALRLGFDFCGISKAEFLEEEAPHLEKWLELGMNGKMQYMENYFDKRLDPRKLVDGAKSVISLMLNYYPASAKATAGEASPKISKYAYGKDYHYVIKDKLKELLQVMNEEIGEIHGRAFVDSAPVLDRAWAAKSGLGWIGKNAQLIRPKSGSFFFLAELIVDIDLETDAPMKDYCGTCTRCMDACPTQAIIGPKIVDGSKCISYFTIELKENMPEEMKSKLDGWIFGCDVCQDVCPWNSFSLPHKTKEMQPNPAILNMTKQDWEEITEEVFKNTFKGSPLQRAGFAGIKRNLSYLST
ncbi:MAG TPA: tRNA epoxyqueuosine(34) reductase QueG [Bacteroidia bacterium]|jgi:epoxyqueuosine reductase|nr:tRNA epoxyqueuosine(34) reductase QueG [Bacteroidia bacterium]